MGAVAQAEGFVKGPTLQSIFHYACSNLALRPFLNRPGDGHFPFIKPGADIRQFLKLLAGQVVIVIGTHGCITIGTDQSAGFIFAHTGNHDLVTRQFGFQNILQLLTLAVNEAGDSKPVPALDSVL